MHVYESHLGGFYTSKNYYNYEDLYCEECGDSDDYIGYFDSAVKALAYIANYIAIDNMGGYSLQDTLEALKDYDDCPSYEDALKIVRENYVPYDERD